MWTYDLAREQCPTFEHLRRMCDLSLESGYNALGLYLEHRFAFECTPWAHGIGALTPEVAIKLQDAYPDLQIVPFINVLSHFEGFINTEFGKRYAEEVFKGLQACPSDPQFVHLAERMIDETIAVFRSPLIHIGGDEAGQLGRCPKCKARMEEFEKGANVDGKALLFGLHFGDLTRKVLLAGRTPGIWGDMLLEHPQAIEHLPKEAIVFNWQYFTAPHETGSKLAKRHPVVYCPALHTYNASWLHLAQSERNLRQHVQDAGQSSDLSAVWEKLGEAKVEAGVIGVCLTTWECALFGNYETLFPTIRACGKIMSEGPEHHTVEAPPEHEGGVLEDHKQADDSPLKRFIRSLLARAEEDCITELRWKPEGRKYRITGKSQIGFDYELTIPRALGEAAIHGMRANAGLFGGQATAQKGKLEPGWLGFDLEYTPDAAGPSLVLTREVERIDTDRLVAFASSSLEAYGQESEAHREWARLMGIELQRTGGMFAFGRIRSSLKCRLLLYGNPFLAWLHHSKELCGEVGDIAIEIAARAQAIAPDASYRGVSTFVLKGIEFVRLAEQARQAYAQELPGVATSCLAPCRQIFEELEKVAMATHLNIGGSLADVERCKVAKQHVELVIRRVKEYGDGSLGYLPSFEQITHPKFMPHDQGAWWLINVWANQ